MQHKKHLCTALISSALLASTACTTRPVVLGVTTPRRDKRVFRFGESTLFSDESSDEESASSIVFNERTLFSDETSAASNEAPRGRVNSLSGPSIVFNSPRPSHRQEERSLSYSDDRSIVFYSSRQVTGSDAERTTYSDSEHIHDTPCRTIPSRYPPSPRGYPVDTDSSASSPNSYRHEPRKSPSSCAKIRKCCFGTRRRPASPRGYNYDSPRIEDESFLVDNGSDISVWETDWVSDRDNSEDSNAPKGRGPGRYWQDDDPRAPRERGVKTPACSDDEVSESKWETPRAQESLYDILLSPRMKDPRVPLGRMTGFRTMSQFEELKGEVAAPHRADVNRAEQIAKQIADKGCHKALFEPKYEDVEPFVLFIAYEAPTEARDKFMAALGAQPKNVRCSWLNLIPIQLLSYAPPHDEVMSTLARRLDTDNLNKAILGDDYDRVVRLAAPMLVSRLIEFDKSQWLDIVLNAVLYELQSGDRMVALEKALKHLISHGTEKQVLRDLVRAVKEDSIRAVHSLSHDMRRHLGMNRYLEFTESDESSSEEAKSCLSRIRKRKRR